MVRAGVSERAGSGEREGAPELWRLWGREGLRRTHNQHPQASLVWILPSAALTPGESLTGGVDLQPGFKLHLRGLPLPTLSPGWPTTCFYMALKLGTLSTFLFFIFLNKFIYFIYLFLAALGLCCCMRGFSSCGERGLLFVAVRGLLSAVASLVAERGL